MAMQPSEYVVTFGGRALGLHPCRRGTTSFTRLSSKLVDATIQFAGSFLPPYVATMASGQLHSGHTLGGRFGFVDELVFDGGRLERLGGTTTAVIGMMHSNPSDEPDLKKWIAAGPSLGQPHRSAVRVMATHNLIRKRRRPTPRADRKSGHQKAGKLRLVCESVNHMGERRLGDTTLRAFTRGEPGYETWLVAQQLHGDVKWCTLCRRFAVKRGAIKRRDPQNKARTVTMAFPNSTSLESLAASTFGSQVKRSELSKSLIALKHRCTVMVCVGALLTEVQPAAAGDWRALYATLTAVGSAARSGAMGAFMNVLMPTRAKQVTKGNGHSHDPKAPSHRKIWITAAFMDSGTLSAVHVWALVHGNNKKIATSCLPTMMQDQSIAIAFATIGRAELTVGPPTTADRTFFALSDEAIASYSATAMPKSVQYIFFKYPGTPVGTKCMVACRAWFDVVNAFRRGWRVQIILTGPLSPDRIKPGLPENSVHALVEVLPNDGLAQKRLDPKFCKPARYVSAPAITAGEYLTWGILASHLALRRTVHGATTSPSRFQPLVIYMSVTKAMGGAGHTYHLMGGHEVTLTYGSCARDLVQLNQQRHPPSFTLEHGIFADFTNDRANGRHARLVREAYVRDAAWLKTGHDTTTEVMTTCMLWDSM